MQQEILGNKELMKILIFFIKNPSSEFSQTEVIKNLKTSKTTVIKWINLLEKYGFIKLKIIGRSKLYRLNKDNCIVKQIKIFFNLLQVMPLSTISDEIYLYGSAARGEDIEDSDIDIMIIGKMNRSDIIKEIDKLSKKIKKNISFKIFDHQEWSNVARNDKPFYERVEKDKILIK